MYYTVIKHDGHLRTREKCRKHSPAARVFYISRVFSNVQSVLSQCNTRLRLLHLLYDIEVMWRKTIKHAFSVLYSDKTRVFDQSERACFPIYIIMSDKSRRLSCLSASATNADVMSYLICSKTIKRSILWL